MHSTGILTLSLTLTSILIIIVFVHINVVHHIHFHNYVRIRQRQTHGVHLQMFLAGLPVGKLLTAQLALEVLILPIDEHLVAAMAHNKLAPFLSGVVDVHMLLQLKLLLVRLAAEYALDGERSRVDPLEVFQMVLLQEPLFAHRAGFFNQRQILTRLTLELLQMGEQCLGSAENPTTNGAGVLARPSHMIRPDVFYHFCPVNEINQANSTLVVFGILNGDGFVQTRSQGFEIRWAVGRIGVQS